MGLKKALWDSRAQRTFMTKRFKFWRLRALALLGEWKEGAFKESISRPGAQALSHSTRCDLETLDVKQNFNNGNAHLACPSRWLPSEHETARPDAPRISFGNIYQNGEYLQTSDTWGSLSKHHHDAMVPRPHSCPLSEGLCSLGT